MNIPTKIYESLTAPERIRAAISATARDDDAEIARLRTSCPKLPFLVTDPAYAERMKRIIMLLMEFEGELRGYAIDYLRCNPIKEFLDERDAIFESIANMHAALRIYAEGEGIDFAELEVCGPPRHPIVAVMIKLAMDHEDPEQAAALAAEYREFVFT
jgi:hypothetical protein